MNWRYHFGSIYQKIPLHEIPTKTTSQFNWLPIYICCRTRNAFSFAFSGSSWMRMLNCGILQKALRSHTYLTWNDMEIEVVFVLIVASDLRIRSWTDFIFQPYLHTNFCCERKFLYEINIKMKFGIERCSKKSKIHPFNNFVICKWFEFVKRIMWNGSVYRMNLMY